MKSSFIISSLFPTSSGLRLGRGPFQAYGPGALSEHPRALGGAYVVRSSSACSAAADCTPPKET